MEPLQAWEHGPGKLENQIDINQGSGWRVSGWRGRILSHRPAYFGLLLIFLGSFNVKPCCGMPWPGEALTIAIRGTGRKA